MVDPMREESKIRVPSTIHFREELPKLELLCLAAALFQIIDT